MSKKTLSLRDLKTSLSLHKQDCTLYRKFRNFCMTFISRIFFYRIIHDVLNLQPCVCVMFMAHTDSLLARTFARQQTCEYSRKFSQTFPNLQYI